VTATECPEACVGNESRALTCRLRPASDRLTSRDMDRRGFARLATPTFPTNPGECRHDPIPIVRTQALITEPPRELRAHARDHLGIAKFLKILRNPRGLEPWRQYLRRSASECATGVARIVWDRRLDDEVEAKRSQIGVAVEIRHLTPERVCAPSIIG